MTWLEVTAVYESGRVISDEMPRSFLKGEIREWACDCLKYGCELPLNFKVKCTISGLKAKRLFAQVEQDFNRYFPGLYEASALYFKNGNTAMYFFLK